MTSPQYRIDSHAHVFLQHLPMAAERRYAPTYDAPLENYLEQLDRNELTHGVLIQPSFLGTDNAFLVSCLQQAAGRLRGIAVVAPTTTADELKRLDDAGIVGIRLNLLGRELPDLSERSWQQLLCEVAALGWQIELQRDARDLARLIPVLVGRGIPVVLDHFALPDPRLGVDDHGFRTILSLAASRRVWVKLSACYRLGPHGAIFAKAAYPLLREAFGIDRLMWGSDWPHTQHESTQNFAMNLRRLGDIVGTDLNAILEAPRNLFRF